MSMHPCIRPSVSEVLTLRTTSWNHVSWEPDSPLGEAGFTQAWPEVGSEKEGRMKGMHKSDLRMIF